MFIPTQNSNTLVPALGVQAQGGHDDGDGLIEDGLESLSIYPVPFINSRSNCGKHKKYLSVAAYRFADGSNWQDA